MIKENRFFNELHLLNLKLYCINTRAPIQYKYVVLLL